MLYAIVAVIVLILDQASKYWVVSNLDLGATSPLLPGIVQLTNIQNDGSAFSFLSGLGARWFFVALTLIVTIAAIVLLNKDVIKGKLGRWTLVFVIAGGLGNCIDRIFKGYVTDMFQLQFKIFGMDFAIFNVADIFITVCGILFCIYLIFHREPEKEPVAAPARTPVRPTPSEHAVKADYISQLKKPVVEGRKSIEAEIAAKTADAALVRSTDNSGTITDWNIPDFVAESKPAEPKPEQPKPAPAETVRRPAPIPKAGTDYEKLFSEPLKPSVPAEPSVVPTASKIDEFLKETAKPEKKSDSEFSLDDIIAEFKD